MIRRVHIKNFRCLRDVELELGPLTVLVGPNASGKSAMLSALESTHWGWPDHWRHETDSPVSMRFDFADGSSVDVDEQRPSAAYRYQRLQLDVTQLRTANLLQRETQLAANGANLANIFGSLTRKQQAALSQQFCQLVPMFMDLDSQPLASGEHSLRFQDRWTPSVWYAPHEVSDGTMLVVAFLVLQYQDVPVALLGIEEPERGLHPYLLGEIVKLLRGMATGKIGPRPIQVVLATHSAELLELVQPEEVRFLNRVPEDGSVKITRIDTSSPDWQLAFKEYSESLGSAWLAGGLGGVPGAEAAE